MEAIMNRIVTLHVSDVMSKKVVWVSTRQPMSDVAALLLRHELSSAPVVDEVGRCVGMISATDFLRRETSSRGEENAPQRVKPAWKPEDVAGTYMSKAVQLIDSQATLLQAAKIVCSQHVHRLPVVDRDSRLVGVVSTMDMVAAITNAVAENDLEGL